jgi:hypothetical protein
MSDWPGQCQIWLRTGTLPGDARTQTEAWAGVGGLGPGEVEAILLARALRADWLLTDDAGARLIASFLGLEVHGSLGVILWAAATRHIDRQDAVSVLDRLAATSSSAGDPRVWAPRQERPPASLLPVRLIAGSWLRRSRSGCPGKSGRRRRCTGSTRN